jgi:hypothetical protein
VKHSESLGPATLHRLKLSTRIVTFHTVTYKQQKFAVSIGNFLFLSETTPTPSQNGRYHSLPRSSNPSIQARGRPESRYTTPPSTLPPPHLLTFRRSSRTPHNPLRPRPRSARDSHPRTCTFPHFLLLPLTNSVHPLNTQKPRRKRCLLLVPRKQRPLHLLLPCRRIRRPKNQLNISLYGNTYQEIQQARRTNCY